MPRACPVESHDSCYPTSKNLDSRCHGLAPWSFTFEATIADIVSPPRGQPVASRQDFLSWRVADIVKTPRGKPVASCLQSIHGYGGGVEGGGAAEGVDGLVVGEVVDALAGVLLGHLELIAGAIVAPAVRDTNHARHHLV